MDTHERTLPAKVLWFIITFAFFTTLLFLGAAAGFSALGASDRVASYLATGAVALLCLTAIRVLG